MEGDAAHRRALGFAAIAAGERQLKLARGCEGIVKEHLVKIAETVKQEVALVLILYFKILLHHWCHNATPLIS